MPSFSFSGEDFASAFASLGKKYAVWGPKRLKGRGRFFGTDLITDAPLQAFDELETDEKSAMSPKSVVFPPDETLFYFTGDRFSEPPLEDERETIVFLRACDINGFRRLDAMFLENGGTPDPFYRRRREKLHFFMIECRESFGNCFCVSMGSSTTENCAAAFRFGENSVEVEIKDPRFAQDFSSGVPSAFVPEFVKENPKKVAVPDVEEMPPELFSSPLRDEYDSRCISCGRCNTSCVTCTCFSSLDLFYSDSRNCGECVLACPTGAWTRRPGSLYRLLIMGRTGKKNPRLAMPFLDRVTEDVVLAVIRNTLDYVDGHILRNLVKEHIGYIVDRTGYPVFRDAVLEGVTLNPEARVAKTMSWPGYHTLDDGNLKDVE